MTPGGVAAVDTRCSRHWPIPAPHLGFAVMRGYAALDEGRTNRAR
jgi:hypothetical protein